MIDTLIDAGAMISPEIDDRATNIVTDGETKTVGVLGGMGPDATVDFMAKVIALTPADKDQDHIRMLVDHNPKVPNRQHAMLGNAEDPGPVIAAMAVGLEKAGAEFLVMPCNTAHAFIDSIEAAVRVPLISIIDLTVTACMEFENVGILATDSCLQSRIYQNALAVGNIAVVQPDDDELATLMGLITQIKSGDRSDAIALSMQCLAETLVAKGAQAVIAGCTEIPLVLSEAMLEVPLIASTDVLAVATVEIARGNLDKDPR